MRLHWRCYWRGDVAALSLLAVAPIGPYTLDLFASRSQMAFGELYWTAATNTRLADSPDLSSTGCNSLMAFHGVQAFEIWK